MNTDEMLIRPVLARVTYIGLAMNVMLPVAILIAALVAFDRRISDSGGLHLYVNRNVEVFFYVFVVVTVMEFAAAYLIRTRLPSIVLDLHSKRPEDRFERSAVKSAIVTYSFNATFALYGLILLLLGAAIEVMMLFAALTMIGFQMLRPRHGYLERMLARVSPEIVRIDDGERDENT